MNIKVTPVAKDDLEALGDTDYQRVASALHDRLPTSVDQDPEIELAELRTNVRVHRIAEGHLRVLYTLRDVDSDGEDEIVILRVMSKTDGFYSDLSESDIPVERLPRSVRIGHELLSKLEALGV